MSDFKIVSYNNGLKYLHIPLKSKIVSIGFVVKVGSRDEDHKNNGISHFLEHMLFKGTKKRNTSKLLNELDDLGTYYNAMTTFDYTAYELHGSTEDLKKLLDIFIDLYLGANLFKKDIEKERKVIMEEYNMTINDADDYLTDIMMNEIFYGSSLAMPIIGTSKNIKKFTRNNLVNYRNKFYCPANTVFITVGDINYKQVEKILRKKINFNCNQENLRLHIIPQQEFPRLNINNSESTGQVNILLSFHHNGYLHDSEYNLVSKVICNYLTSGSSSKLFDTLRTKNALAYSCSSFNTELEDTSIFIIKTAVDEKRCDLAVNKILFELLKIIKYKISAKDLNRSKKKLNNKSIINKSNMELINHYFDESIKSLNNILSYENEINEISKITSKDVLKACRHIFRHNNLNLVVMGNMSKKAKDNIETHLDKWYNLTKNM
jgi:predicted Zn-dependent peptidase